MKNRVLSVILAVSMFIMSGCMQKNYYDITALSTTDFSAMTYGEQDYAAMLEEAVNKTHTMAEEQAGEEEIMRELESIRDILTEIQNDYDLTYLHMSIDYSQENIEKNKAATDNINAVNKIYDDLIYDLCDMGYKQVISDFTGEGISDEELNNKPSDRYYELQSRETELVAEYQSKADNAVNSNDTVLGGIFKELVGVRTEIAKERGYDNYADYVYEEIYKRDYTTADAAQLHRNVKEIIAPVSVELLDYVTMNARGGGYFTSEEVLRFLSICAENISPEIKASYDCMMNNHLYSIDYSENKMLRNAYTMFLDKYDLPFIFANDPDVSTITHEFGHFNQRLYCGYEDETNNLDLAEIHSQGFELLCIEYYDEIYKDRAEMQRAYLVASKLSAIVQSSLVDEWETEIYRNPDMTADEYDTLFAKLSEEYCLEYASGHDWVKMPHPFLSPMYMVSYATSGIASMEIWEISQKNRDKAVDKYMKMTAKDTGGGFKEVIKQCGFDDVFDEKTLRGIAKQVEEGFLK